MNTLIDAVKALHTEIDRLYTLKSKPARDRAMELVSELRRQAAMLALDAFGDAKHVKLSGAVYQQPFGGGVGGATGVFKVIDCHGSIIVVADADGDVLEIPLLDRPCGAINIERIEVVNA